MLLDVAAVSRRAQPRHRLGPSRAARFAPISWRLPAESRETLLARPDATLIFAQPRGLRTQEVTARAAKLSRLASAMLAHAGLGGPLHHAILEGAADTT